MPLPFSIVNNSAMNMHVQIPLQNPASILFGLHPTAELLDHMTVLCKIYKHNEILLSQKKE